MIIGPCNVNSETCNMIRGQRNANRGPSNEILRPCNVIM